MTGKGETTQTGTGKAARKRLEAPTEAPVMDMMTFLKESFSKNEEKLNEIRNQTMEGLNRTNVCLEELKKNFGENIQEMERRFDDKINTMASEISIRIDEEITGATAEVRQELNTRVGQIEGALGEEVQRIEQKFDDMDNRMRQMQRRSASVASGALVVPKMSLKPSNFDGKRTWSEYETQFEIIAHMNDWSDEEKASVLAAMLRDSALSVLQNLPPEERLNYRSLVSALRRRFSDEHLVDLYRVQLKNRVQMPKEDLTTFGYEVERLAHLAFPECPVQVQDHLAITQFIDGLANAELRRLMFRSKPRSFKKALEEVIELDAADRLTVGVG